MAKALWNRTTKIRTAARSRCVLVVLSAFSAMAAVAAPAVSASAATSPPCSLNIVAAGTTFTLSTTEVQAGVVRIALHNGDTYPGALESAQVARMPDGMSEDQFVAALQANQFAAYNLLDFEGGPNTTAAGDTQSTLDLLTPGLYVVLSFIPDSNGVIKDLEGMLAWFTVVGPTTESAAHVPTDGTIYSYSFGFTIPSVVKSHAIYHYVNQSTDTVHELGFVRLLPGKTFDDFKAWVLSNYAGPPPGVAEGGVSSIENTSQSWAVTDMPPGNYVAADWVFDTTTGLKYAAMGALVPFTVVDG